MAKMMQTKLLDYLNNDNYRYILTREFNAGYGSILYVMLNPSTATQEIDDPTIRRCIGFAKRERCRYMEVVNLFALRATDPSELKKSADPIGPGNDEIIRDAVQRSGKVILAWGTHGTLNDRDNEVTRLIWEDCQPWPDKGPYCFGQNANGTPKHPLFLKADTPIVKYIPRYYKKQ